MDVGQRNMNKLHRPIKHKYVVPSLSHNLSLLTRQWERIQRERGASEIGSALPLPHDFWMWLFVLRTLSSSSRRRSSSCMCWYIPSTLERMPRGCSEAGVCVLLFFFVSAFSSVETSLANRHGCSIISITSVVSFSPCWPSPPSRDHIHPPWLPIPILQNHLPPPSIIDHLFALSIIIEPAVHRGSWRILYSYHAACWSCALRKKTEKK